MTMTDPFLLLRLVALCKTIGSFGAKKEKKHSEDSFGPLKRGICCILSLQSQSPLIIQVRKIRTEKVVVVVRQRGAKSISIKSFLGLVSSSQSAP
jgi:hypothetical protein